jgi:hypothetical protein
METSVANIITRALDRRIESVDRIEVDGNFGNHLR